MICYLTNNRCYKSGASLKPTGIVVHSTGANNPLLKRYVQPSKTDPNYYGLLSELGTNKYLNSWNNTLISKCVHAFIGKTATGEVKRCDTLPLSMQCWGCGKGKYGSYNTSHFQFEICEDDLTDEAYFKEVFRVAAEYCAALCRNYNLSVYSICSHAEAHQRGYASNHADCDHWLKKFNKTMDDFRGEVAKLLNEEKPVATTFRVKVTDPSLNIRSGPGTNYGKTGVIKDRGVYTIVDTKPGQGSTSGWGKLKSGAGWISLDFTRTL